MAVSEHVRTDRISGTENTGDRRPVQLTSVVLSITMYK